MLRLKELYTKFICSDYFILFMFTLNVIFWGLKLGLAMMIISSIILISIILLDIDRTSIITIALANVINYRIAKLEENVMILIVFSLVLLPFVIYDFIKHKINYKNNIFISMVIFTIANILSLVNTNKDTIGLGVAGVSQFVCYTVIFLYFNTYRKITNFIYISKNMAIMGLAIAIQFIIKFSQFEGDAINKAVIDLGWGLSNYIAIVMSIIIPLTFYLYIHNHKNKLALILVVIDFVVLILTFSKGAILAWGIILIPFLAFAYIYSKDKKKILIDGLICFSLFTIFIFIISKIDFIWDGFITYFDRMDDRGWFKDEARIRIYKIGLEQFKNNPIFGSGAYTGRYYIGSNINYHNFLIQTIATTGIVGLLSFLYYLFNILKSTLVKHYFNIIVLFILILLSFHGMVDTTWYNPLVMVILSIVLPQLLKKEEVDNLIFM